MKTIHFNTGRKYTVHGQRISATVHEDGWMTFYDHDRMIDGTVNGLWGEGNLTPEFVRVAYDQGHWSSTERSFADGILRNGCNTKYEG